MLLLNAKLSVYTSMTEIKPVVMEKQDFKYRDETYSYHFLEFYDYHKSDINVNLKTLLINCSATRAKFSKKTLMEEIKLEDQELDTWMKTNCFSITSSSASANFSIRALVEESNLLLLKKRVQVSRYIKNDSSFRNFRTAMIVTQGTKLSIFKEVLS